MDELLQTLYECGICHEPVNYPKKLQCQHIFCHQCLVGYITEHIGTTSLSCPVCNFKHVPVEPETEVGEIMIAILEEDSLTRSLLQFSNIERRKPLTLTTDDGVVKLPCLTHPRNVCEYYDAKCNVLACSFCKRDAHRACYLQTITKSMKTACYHKVRKVSSDLEAVMTRTRTVQEQLASKLEYVNPDREDQVAVTKAYYVDLKEKVIRYLEEQESKVLEMTEELEKSEKDHLRRDMGVCESLLESLDVRQKLALALQMQTETKSSQNMVIAGHLSDNVESYNTGLLPKLEADVSKQLDMRFMINTDLEDRFVDTDIVKIEVIDSCHAGPFAVTFTESDVSARRGSTAPGPRDSRNFPQTAPAGRERRHTSTPLAEQEEDELPPSYGTVLQNPSMQLPPPFGNSALHRAVASAPPLPTVPPPAPVHPSAPPIPAAGLYDDDQDNVSYQSDRTSLYFQPSVDESAESTGQPLSGDGVSVPSVSPFAHIARQRERARQRAGQELVGLKLKTSVDIALSGDEWIPSIVAIATVGDAFVIVDQVNYCMKVLSQRGSLLNVYDFGTTEPWDVTTISDTECVVTAPRQRQLLFLSDPGLKHGSETSVRKAMTTGQYARIAFHNRTKTLIGCRCPPFSVARIDLVNMQGYVMKKVPLDSFANPRTMVMTESFDLILCDLKRREVTFLKPELSASVAPLRYTGSSNFRLKSPHGVSTVNGMNIVLILDGSDGNIFVTSFTGETRKVLGQQISLGDSDTNYQICSNIDGTILAVCKADGLVMLYDMEYGAGDLPSTTLV